MVDNVFMTAGDREETGSEGNLSYSSLWTDRVFSVCVWWGERQFSSLQHRTKSKQVLWIEEDKALRKGSR